MIAARNELEQTVAEYHHVQSEHRRAGAEGRVRRHLHARLARLEAHFERLLAEFVAGEAARDAWRRRLHQGSPPPAEPLPLEATLIFKGRSGAGSVVEVRQRPDGDCDVFVGGARLERVAAAGGGARGTCRTRQAQDTTRLRRNAAANRPPGALSSSWQAIAY